VADVLAQAIAPFDMAKENLAARPETKKGSAGQ
jgi:hypothetical protein